MNIYFEENYGIYLRDCKGSPIQLMVNGIISFGFFKRRAHKKSSNKVFLKFCTILFKYCQIWCNKIRTMTNVLKRFIIEKLHGRSWNRNMPLSMKYASVVLFEFDVRDNNFMRHCCGGHRYVFSISESKNKLFYNQRNIKFWLSVCVLRGTLCGRCNTFSKHCNWHNCCICFMQFLFKWGKVCCSFMHISIENRIPRRFESVQPFLQTLNNSVANSFYCRVGTFSDFFFFCNI